METLEDRLKKARTSLGLSQEEMAEAVGAKKRGYQDNERGVTTPNSSVIAGFVKLGFNANWLLSGVGGMRLEQVRHIKPSPDIVEEDKVRLYNLGKPIKRRLNSVESEVVQVPIYSVQVSTGNGAICDDEKITGSEPYSRAYLRKRNLQFENLAIVSSKGDSMEPTITNNDRLLVDISRTTPIDGKIFVIRLGEELYAKRVQCLVGGGLTIISDNKEYPPQVLDQTQVHQLEVIGQVMRISKDT
ncbi:putative HTH-type transcriptional regulator [Allocatenococcus thiocycli]|nr:putative HTH-type transcriptional regulator [Catenococcus thiocycli]